MHARSWWRKNIKYSATLFPCTAAYFLIRFVVCHRRACRIVGPTAGHKLKSP